jgi:hypothetical protein
MMRIPCFAPVLSNKDQQQNDWAACLSIIKASILVLTTNGFCVQQMFLVSGHVFSFHNIKTKAFDCESGGSCSKEFELGRSST